MPIATIAGEPFHYRFDGPADAPVLLLSNSLGTDLGMWDQQIPAWSRQYRVLRYDSRGHGASVAGDGPYAMAQLGRDAVNLLDALGIEKVHYCGLSKGGMVGMWLLTHAAHRIDRAVLANTAAVMGPPDNWNGRIRTVNAKGMAVIAAGLADRWFTKRFQASNPADVARFCDLIARQPAKGYVARAAAIRDMDQHEAIRAIDRPVLVIIGDKDPATPPPCGVFIRDAIPGARSLTLDAAHLSNVEQPEAFANAVLEFLA